MRIMTVALMLCLQATLACTQAYAEDFSPWFGSADQKPFRMEVAATGVAGDDVVSTNSTEPPACDLASCPPSQKAANTTGGQVGLSQN